MQFNPIIAAIFFTVLLTQTSSALTIKNADSKPQTVVVTENGLRQDFEIAPASEISVCLAGCFVRFPVGDMSVYRGTEEVTIQNGAGWLTAK